MEQFIVSQDESGVRLDRWLADRMPARTRSQIQLDLEAGRILVNGEPKPARYKLRPGDQIAYDVPPEESNELIPQDIPLRIIYEDEHLLVIDKPAGMVVHPAPGHSQGTVANALLAHCGPALEGVGSDEGRWGIVHRLDNLTSGLMMAAKTQPAYEALVAALAQRRIHRRYLGIVLGMFKESDGSVDQPIGRRRSDRKLMGIIAEGRPARTDWHLICQGNAMALAGLKLHSGRTHQIRVHMQSIGKPILGDESYGWSKQRTLQMLGQMMRNEVVKVWPERQMLHAASLQFNHPIDPSKRLNLISPPPADMEAVMNTLWADAWRDVTRQWLELVVEDEEETDEAQ